MYNMYVMFFEFGSCVHVRSAMKRAVDSLLAILLLLHTQTDCVQPATSSSMVMTASSGSPFFRFL